MCIIHFNKCEKYTYVKVQELNNKEKIIVILDSKDIQYFQVRIEKKSSKCSPNNYFDYVK